MEYIKAESDISFNSVDALAVWLYVNKSTNEHYQDAINATMGIYPEFGERMNIAISSAPKNPKWVEEQKKLQLMEAQKKTQQQQIKPVQPVAK